MNLLHSNTGIGILSRRDSEAGMMCPSCFFWLVGIQLVVSQQSSAEICIVAPLITTISTTNAELVLQIFCTHTASMFKLIAVLDPLFDGFDAAFSLLEELSMMECACTINYAFGICK